MDGLSDRAHRLHAGGLAEYLVEHLARRHDPRYVGLCLAENNQMWDLLGPRLAGPHPLEPSVTSYDDMAGSSRFREELADLFERHVFGRRPDPDSIVTMAGAGAILEAVGYALAGPGDGILVPTPGYPGFWPDLEQRAGAVIVPVPTLAAAGFSLSPDLLDEAVARSPAPVRALLYTNPHNPLGRVARSEEVAQVVGWAERRGIHLIVDEIYALSAFGEVPFASVGSAPLGERIHVVWAFSKDFAMSGLRAGVLITENPDLRAAVASQATWGSVSTLTQSVLTGLLADRVWVDHFLSEMRDRLRSIHRQVTRALDRGGIRYLPSDAGFFVMLDLRDRLDEPTWEAERGLWWTMLEGAGVNLTPGAACRAAEPGFFRLCFAGIPTPSVLDGLDRISGLG